MPVSVVEMMVAALAGSAQNKEARSPRAIRMMGRQDLRNGVGRDGA